MKATIVWFNGLSRNQLLNKFPLQENEIGCNFIRRDRAVGHVVCFDQEIVKENNKNIEQDVKYYTRDAYQKPPWNIVHQCHGVDPINSGMLAVLLATNLAQDPVYIIGCDWGLNHNSVYNYGKVSPHKYTNSCNRHIRLMSKTHKIIAVHDQLPDIDCEIMHNKSFLSLFTK